MKSTSSAVMDILESRKNLSLIAAFERTVYSSWTFAVFFGKPEQHAGWGIWRDKALRHIHLEQSAPDRCPSARLNVRSTLYLWHSALKMLEHYGLSYRLVTLFQIHGDHVEISTKCEWYWTLTGSETQINFLHNLIWEHFTPSIWDRKNIHMNHYELLQRQIPTLDNSLLKCCF